MQYSPSGSFSEDSTCMSDQAHIFMDATTRHHNCWRISCPLSSYPRDSKVDDERQVYNNLRVLIPGGNQDAEAALSCPGTPSPCTAKQPFSQRRLQAPALLKMAPSPACSSSAAVGPDVPKAGVNAGCPTARRLLVGDDSYDEVSSWLDQQTGIRATDRQGRNSAIRQGTQMSLKCMGDGVFAGSAAAELVAGLPPPAFELLGLL